MIKMVCAGCDNLRHAGGMWEVRRERRRVARREWLRIEDVVRGRRERHLGSRVTLNPHGRQEEFIRQFFGLAS